MEAEAEDPAHHHEAERAQPRRIRLTLPENPAKEAEDDQKADDDAPVDALQDQPADRADRAAVIRAGIERTLAWIANHGLPPISAAIRRRGGRQNAQSLLN